MTDGLDLRLVSLRERLVGLGSVVVAFSGGVDSALLVAAAVRALGPDRVLAATSTSASLAQGEWEQAHNLCRELGVEHIAVATDEMQREGYRRNDADRCFHCKSALGDELTRVARDRGFSFVATGTNADDLLEPHRPGLRAAADRGVVTPLADAGLSKADVREVSRWWRLPTWDKPQAACLASRLAYGVTVDPLRLARVDRAEAAVRAEAAHQGCTLRNVRVRDLGDRARVEVDREVLATLDGARIRQAVREAGFAEADLDPRGFRTGSLNEALAADQLVPGQLRGSSWDLPLVD